MEYSTIDRIKVSIESPKADSSWGIVASDLLQGFLNIGVEASTTPRKGTDLLRWGPPHLWTWDSSEFRGVVGYVINEGDFLDQENLDAIVSGCESCDVLVFPSTAAEWAYLSAPIDRPRYLVSLGIDTDSFVFHKRDFHSKPLTFLHYGVIQPRKGTDLLINAFTNEFRNETDVKLIIHHWTNWMDWYSAYKEDNARIEFSSEELTRVGLVKLLRSAHCLVAPSLGEGFGLTVFESLATGLPTIVSRIPSFCASFSSDQVFFVEMSNNLLPAGMVFPHWRPGSFRLPAIASLQEQLRRVYTNRSLLSARSKPVSDFVRGSFSRETMCKKLVNCLVEARYVKWRKDSTGGSSIA